jgi:NADH dehydrogenase (ubiquinone) 1 beta subcomplex subunit 8
MHRALLSSSKCLSRSVLFRGISTSQAALGGFTRDFKPGPYPKTEAERVAAAKKYGLLYSIILI